MLTDRKRLGRRHNTSTEELSAIDVTMKQIGVQHDTENGTGNPPYSILPYSIGPGWLGWMSADPAAGPACVFVVEGERS
jgi:hypothetical protein